ncbi:GtrA family protein [Methylohalobius crimeensis]|uniref:GtrA family protein n=1 Tax=Methylohalobius crimeensis TaxID=244365 RepID=UPI0004195D75|nr:GtrA family protein [Methylohalobius crimeensis]
MIVRQFLRFAWVGVLGFGVNGGGVAWLSPHIGPLWAQAVGFPLAATFTWWLNRHFTFGPSERSLRREWAYYVSANGIGWLANNGSYVLLVTQSALFHRYPVLAVAVGSVAGMFFNFGLSRYFVFSGGHRSNASVPAFQRRFPFLTIASISVGATGRSPLLWLLVYPFLLKAPLWTGWFISDPFVSFGDLALDVGGRILPGLPTIDNNIAFTSDALGQRAADDWLAGKIPWWNPYEGTGTLLAAEMQSAALFLPFILFYALPHGQLWFHLCLQVMAGWGTFFLLRRLGLGMLAAVTGGLLFEMNGTYAWLANAVINPICFLPWFLLGVEETVRLVREGHGIGWLCLPLALSLSLYAGFPEVAYINGLLVLIWTLVRLGQLQGSQRWRFLGWITGGGTAGILLSLPVVVPFFEFLTMADVGGHQASALGNQSLPAHGLMASFFPYFFGPIGYGGWSGSATWWGSIGGYLGFGPVFLAAFALLGKRERWLKIGILAWILLGLAKALGMPGITQLLNLLPMVELAAFFRYVWPSLSMGIVVLAAFALDDLVRRNGHMKLSWIPLLSVMALVAFAFGLTWDFLWQLNTASSLIWWTLDSLALGALVFACTAWLGYFKRHDSAPLVAAVVLFESTILFLIPVFSSPKRGNLHLEGVAYLEQKLGLQRFYTTGPLAPNYGSVFEIAQLNYNDLPIPKNLADYRRTHFDPYSSAIIFDGHFHPNPSDPDPLQVLRNRIGAYSKAGVSHIITYPYESLDLDQYEVPIQVRDNEALAVYGGEVLRVRLPNIPPGELRIFGVFIGTYHGKADGRLEAKLCQLDYCRTAVSDVKNARDNAFLRFNLSPPVQLIPEVPIEIEFRYLTATQPVALWLWPQVPDSLQDLHASHQNLNGRGLRLKFWYREKNRSGVYLVHRDPVMNIYALDEFRDYFSAEGCRLRADGRNAVMAECDRPSRLVRLETFYPGWRAEVNGKPVPVEETEGLFQQVALPRGHAEIRFTYHPRFYAWIVAGFLSAWLILGVGFLWSRPKPPRRR